MARIKISDLPKDMKISKVEMKKILGGVGTWPTPERPFIGYDYPIRSTTYGVPMSRLYIDTVPLPE